MNQRNNKGQFVEGNPGKPKGAKNKATTKIRQRFCDLLDNNIDKMQSDLDSLEPKDRLDMIFKLSQYVLPRLKQVESNHVPAEITKIERHIIKPKDNDIEPIIIDFTK